MAGRVKTKLKKLVRAVLGLPRRQVAGLVLAAAIGAGVAVASAAGRAALATSLLALLLVAVPAGVIHLTRRVAGVGRANREAVRDLRLLVEQLQRRVIAAVEKERLAAGDRHQELTESLSRAERLTGRGAELLLREQSREIEALFQLFQRVTPRAPMPTGGALNPSDLLGLHTVASSRRPALTVALGSGPAAVWLGYALAPSGGRLVVVDHDRARADQAEAALREHGLTAVEVRHVPLAELSVEGKTVDWYDVDALDGLQDIDLLVVDGTAAPGPDAVSPALHVLGRRLADEGTVVVDEAPTRVAPRQGGFGLAEDRKLAGRWTALAGRRTTSAT
ncbi:class I SAM-dependent methyltransferase [Paractinoplanes rhizophilus]|uniref:Class I SAM-dependent methyltransferase n=1 Tax=Paractinoplanes rhizophilus TaxID=1416877 RepID=A0ABW2HSQ4_9ACTN